MNLVSEFIDAFFGLKFDDGRTHLIRHRIDTQYASPLKERGRPPQLACRGFFDQEVDRLLALEHISEVDPGVCPYASRYVVVRMKDGSFRLCEDFRRLNAQTVKDA